MERAKRYVQNLANELEISYEDLMSGAVNYAVNGQSMCGGDAFERVGSIDVVFWDHFAIITGHKVHPERRESFIRCAC